MSTEALVDRLLDTTSADAGDAVTALRALLDDSAFGDVAAKPLGVAEAARLVHLSPHTLRYYEQQGLVRPARDASGHREYAAHDLRRLVFLTRMRLSGTTMRDLKRYIALVERGDATIPERRRIMLDQRDRIRRRLRELTLALETTEYKLVTYGGHPDG